MNRKITLVLSLVLLASFLFGVPSSLAQNGTKWTFMVYLDADNNLDLAGVSDVVEMQSVGSSFNVEVVVLFDRCGERCGFNGSTVLHIHDGWNETLWGSWSDEHELNMGDPETLTWFINYTVEGFPADKYALILWDHGGNWKGVCWDDTDDDYLEIEEVKEALANSVIGRVDLLGFDACLMASIEVAYTMKLSGKVGVMVASEDSIPWDGWPYDVILEDLVETPSWTEHELAADIVERYVTSYAKVPVAKVYVTLSAIDCSYVDILVDDMAALTEELLTRFDDYKETITGSKNKADRYWFGIWHQGPYIDLHQFISALGDKEKDLKPYTDPISEQWSSLVVASKCWQGPHNRGCKGLTIYFPRNRNSFCTPEPYYESVSEFADETNWHTLLTTYFGM